MCVSVAHATMRGAWYPYTYPMNLTGHPALSMPCGRSALGLPIGLQLAGRWHEERFLLGVAAAGLIVGLLGGDVLYGMVWPLLGRSQALPLLATLGLSLIIQQEATKADQGE